MIQQSILYIVGVFNQFITNKFDLDENTVIASPVILPDGSIPLENKNKIVVSIIHIEQETNKQYYNSSNTLTNGNYTKQNPPEHYNLYLLITSNFDDYEESLKFLNATLQFFQSHTSIDVNSNANIPKGIYKIQFDIENLEGYMQMQNLWTALGAKYQPSIIYKMRLITINTNEVVKFNPVIQNLSTNSLPL